MKNTDHVNWFTIKVYLLGNWSTNINLRYSATCLSAIDRLGLDAKFPPRKAW